MILLAGHRDVLHLTSSNAMLSARYRVTRLLPASASCPFKQSWEVEPAEGVSQVDLKLLI